MEATDLTSIEKLAQELASKISELSSSDDQVEALNKSRSVLHSVSPLRHHPVDCVLWEKVEEVKGNTYNPNVVAPPEMKLLAHSVASNGYTMPIVTHEADEGLVVVDGFHRTRVCKEYKAIGESTLGYLPATRIRVERADQPSRIAATIEHNRARGEHQVDQMSELVRMLHEAGWRENKIMEELGMTSDEVRRLKQITGLAELFANREFSEAWEPEDAT